MKAVYLISNDSYSGKSGIGASIGLTLKEKKKKIGYMKPVGSFSDLDGKMEFDRDAYFIKEILGTNDALEDICPILLNDKSIKDFLKGKKIHPLELIKQSYESISQNKDLLILEGGGSFFEGRLMDCSPFQIAETLEAKILLIIKHTSGFIIDEVLSAKDLAGDKLIGVIINWVVPEKIEQINNLVIPFLKKKGIKVFGLVPRDNSLLSVTVGELANYLNGEVLCAQNRLNQNVESLMVGAMGQEQALRFFKRKGNKAVITGGDRSDVQLAALETQTACLILTGNFQPSPIVLSRAEDLEVPMILVNTDTLTAVEKAEEFIGRIRVHDKSKIEKLSKILKNNVNLSSLFSEILD